MKPKNEKKSDSRVLCITLSKIIYDRLTEMSIHYGVSLAEMARSSFRLAYTQMMKEGFGYKGDQISKEKLKTIKNKKNRDAMRTKIITMTEEELMEFLSSVNYLHPGYKVDGDGYIYEERDDSGEVKYSRVVFASREELLADLINNNFI